MQGQILPLPLKDQLTQSKKSRTEWVIANNSMTILQITYPYFKVSNGQSKHLKIYGKNEYCFLS